MKVEQIDSAINDVSEDWNKLQLEDRQNIVEVIDNDPAEFARLVRVWLQDSIEYQAGETICPECLDRGNIVELEQCTRSEKLEGIAVNYKTAGCPDCGWEG